MNFFVLFYKKKKIKICRDDKMSGVADCGNLNLYDM